MPENSENRIENEGEERNVAFNINTEQKPNENKETLESIPLSPEVNVRLSELPEAEEKKEDSNYTHKSFQISNYLNVAILKPVSIIFFIIVIFSWLFLIAALDTDNKYLSLFGVSENIVKTHKKLSAEKIKLISENSKLNRNNSELDRQIKAKEYFKEQKLISIIQNEMLNWIDTVDSDGNTVYGMIDVVERAVTYFNSDQFDHPYIAGNNVEMTRINIDRKNASVSVKVSNLVGKTFFLATELVDVMNSFPVFKNGEVKSFSKKINKKGSSEMQFELKMDIQKNEDEDSADDNFVGYESWLLRESKTISKSRGPRVQVNE